MNKDLQDAFKNLTQPKGVSFPAKVVSVDKVKGICVVNDGELDYTDVQLSATIEDDKRFLILPKVGSFVIVAPINADIHRLMVIMVSEITEVIARTETAEFSFNDNGFLLKKQNETLKSLMSDLLIAIKNMRFTTNVGPTINLINLVEFQGIETRFNNFLKDS